MFSNFFRFGLETEWFNCSVILACWISPILVSLTRTEPTQVILFAKLLYNQSPGKPCSFPDSTNRTGCHLYGTLTPACYTRFLLPYKPYFFITGTLATAQSTILTETSTSGDIAGLAVASRLSWWLSSKTKDDRRWLNLRRLQHQRGGALLDKKSFGKHQYMIWGLGRYKTMM